MSLQRCPHPTSLPSLSPGAIPDLASVPELRWLEDNYLVPPLTLGLGLWAFSGARAMMYGFMVSTVLCWHCTYAINSIAHVFGSRRLDCEFNTPCTARNNLCARAARALA